MSASLTASDTTRLEFKFGKVAMRISRKPDFVAYLEDHSGTASPTLTALRSDFGRGALAVVVSDIVIDSIQATIGTNLEAGAQIDAALGGVASKALSGPNLSLKLTRSSSGNCTLETTKPVIAMTLVKKQPAVNMLTEDATWDSWPVVQTADPTAAKR